MDKFGREIFGYRKQEVNEVIKQTIIKTEELIEKIQSQEEEINKLKTKIIHYENLLEQSAGNPEKIKRDAEMEAERIKREAKHNANRIISDVLERYEKLEIKSEMTKRNIKKCRNQLRTIMEQQIDIMSQIEDIELDEK